jgi:S1-C subfamily serine protease
MTQFIKRKPNVMKTKTHRLFVLSLVSCFSVCGCVVTPGGKSEIPSPPDPYDCVGNGTGFCVSENGYFLTNYHVVKDADQVRITIDASDQEIVAEVVKTNPRIDLALLKVDGTFRPVRFASETDFRLGEPIWVLGFPNPDRQGTSIKVTQGCVSSEKGPQDEDRSFQMDAAVQPGNSGSPVINEYGEVIGVAAGQLIEEEVLKESGRTPQNVNYAIKGSYITRFLFWSPCEGKFLRGSCWLTRTKRNAIERVRKSTALVRVYKEQELPVWLDDLRPAPAPLPALLPEPAK